VLSKELAMIARVARSLASLLVVGLVAGCGSAGDVGGPESTEGVASTQAALTGCTLDVQAIWDTKLLQTFVQFQPSTTCAGNIEHYVIQLRDDAGKLVLLQVSPPGFAGSPIVSHWFIEPHVGNFVSVQARLGKGVPGGGDRGKGGIFGKGVPGGGDLGDLKGKGDIFGKGVPGGGDLVNGNAFVK
jgi:hypothetical protein